MIAREKLSKLWLMVVIPLVVLLPALAGAQTATLQGKVTDAATGQALPGANVVVSSGGGALTGAASDANGNYTVKNLNAGTYTVAVSFIGYEKKSVSVTLNAGAAETMNFTINPSGISLNETVISASRVEEKVLNAPAAISILEATEIRQTVSPSSQMILANATGVDMAKTGIDREEIVLRGFNNAFSGATYVLTDYRQAAVASLGVNLHSIMPNTAIDLERVEIVRGPGSALYGPGVDAGVIHYITKNPFSFPGTSVSVGGGERSSYYGSFRHAGVLSNKLGYKITGQYAQADDWTLDQNDPVDKEQLDDDFVRSDGTKLQRNYDYLKYNFNGYLQYRLSDRTTLSAAGGNSSLDATVLSGAGTVQADGFGYSYGQLRLQSGNFFAQTYVNKNEAGNSFVYGSGNKVSDASILFNAQAQYDLNLSQGKHKVIVGADYDLTRPDTKGTIYGRNEANDQIQELGGYVQTTSALAAKLDVTLALRGDYNDVQKDFQLSPRVALVLKATPENTFRATYNRAFSSPGNNSNFLDIVSSRTQIGPGTFITARARGNADGFTFNNARAGGGLTSSSLLPGFQGNPFRYANGAGVPTPNSVQLAGVYNVVYAGLATTPVPVLQAGIKAATGRDLPAAAVAGLVQLLSPTLTRVSGTGSSILDRNPEDAEPLQPTITQTLEAGYKGLFQQKVLFAVDGYYSKKKNFVGPVLRESPLAFLTNVAELTPALAQAIANNATLNAQLGAIGLNAPTVAAVLVGFAQENLKRLPVAVVQPDQNQVPGEVFASYRNFGNVDYYGVDAGVQIIATSRLNFFGNVSWVSDDFFDNKELDEAGTSLELALNASKFKAKGGFSYNIPLGLGFNAAGRYSDGFPVRSGISYFGEVESYFLLDVGAGYDLGRFAPGMSFDVMVQNVTNKEHREFIGAPKIGRLALARLSYTF